MIRHAHPADLPAIVAAYDWLFAPPGIRPSDWSPAIATDRLRAAIADDRAAILLADDNHAVVGFATIYLDIVSVRFGQLRGVLSEERDHQTRRISTIVVFFLPLRLPRT